MIELKELTFLSEIDPIKTERTVFEHFGKVKNSNLPPYVALPIAYAINKLGLAKAQQLIDQANYESKDKKIFVCQHIHVNKLKFGNNFVFTPHTVETDSFQFIPHYNPINVEPNFDSLKKYLASFIGDFGTNGIRKRLEKLRSDSILIKNTSGWFFLKGQKDQDKLKEEYIKCLQNSSYSFCPQGTGPSSLRLFESLSVGSVPIIFNNLKLPTDLKKFIVKADINTISQDWIESIKKTDVKEMVDLYQSSYSNQNLAKSIYNFFGEKYV